MMTMMMLILMMLLLLLLLLLCVTSCHMCDSIAPTPPTHFLTAW